MVMWNKYNANGMEAIVLMVVVSADSEQLLQGMQQLLTQGDSAAV